MLDRRRFLILFTKSALALTALGLLDGVRRFLMPPLPPSAPAQVRVQPIPELQPGQQLWLPQARAWLGRDDAGFYALSAICPHLGCTVRGEGQGFRCPCHGSQFGPAGALQHGPAPRGLTRLTVRVEDEALVVVLG